MKFNPYHDRLGRFTTSNGYTSFTYSPGKSKAHDNAIAREKNKREKHIESAKKIIDASRHNIRYVTEQGGIVTEKKDAEKKIADFYEDAAMNKRIWFDKDSEKLHIASSKREELNNIAKDIMRKQEYEDNSTADEYRTLRQYIKSTPINISEYDRHNIPDWNDYRKHAFGNITISRNGIPVDSFYQELSSKFPHLFDSRKQTTPSDQIDRINDTLNSLKPKKYKLEGKELDDSVEYLSLTILRGYVASVLKAS